MEFEFSENLLILGEYKKKLKGKLKDDHTSNL